MTSADFEEQLDGWEWLVEFAGEGVLLLEAMLRSRAAFDDWCAENDSG